MSQFESEMKSVLFIQPSDVRIELNLHWIDESIDTLIDLKIHLEVDDCSELCKYDNENLYLESLCWDESEDGYYDEEILSNV